MNARSPRPLRTSSYLAVLAEGDDLRIGIDIHDQHPVPAAGVAGFQAHAEHWQSRVAAGAITNGVTIAPIALRQEGSSVFIAAVAEDYVTNRAAASCWAALPPSQRVLTVAEQGFDPAYSRFLGTACAVIGSDGLLILARRSQHTATEPGCWAPALGEGMDGADLRRDGTADVLGCVLRGLEEELGISLDGEDAERCIRLQAVTVNGRSGEIVVNGVIDFRQALNYRPTAAEVVDQAGACAVDTWERDRYATIELTAEAVAAFARDTEADLSGYGSFTADLAIRAEPVASMEPGMAA